MKKSSPFLQCAALLFACAGTNLPVAAQIYPAKTIDLVIPEVVPVKVLSPAKIYPIGDPDSPTWSKYMFNQKHILDIHQHILDSGHSSEIPSKAELLGLLKNNFILYTKTEEGKFVPVWKAE